MEQRTILEYSRRDDGQTCVGLSSATLSVGGCLVWIMLHDEASKTLTPRSRYLSANWHRGDGPGSY
jgi:hypothetical protein